MLLFYLYCTKMLCRDCHFWSRPVRSGNEWLKNMAWESVPTKDATVHEWFNTLMKQQWDQMTIHGKHPSVSAFHNDLWKIALPFSNRFLNVPMMTALLKRTVNSSRVTPMLSHTKEKDKFDRFYVSNVSPIQQWE